MSLGSRRITAKDYERIAIAVLSCIEKVQATSDKAIAKSLHENSVMAHIIQSDNAWIVEDSYLVVFSVVTPWWAPYKYFEIREELVLKLSAEGDFSCVPAFLEQRRAAEGASLTAVGTALARSDDALAAKYEQHGFRREATLLIKEA